MAYFPHAYKKVFVGSSFLTEGLTTDLGQGGFGFFDPKTWTAVAPVDATIADHPEVVLVMGPYQNNEYIGPMLGGYKESLKSQIIKPKLIHRFWKVNDRAAVQQVVQAGWDGSESSTSPKFKCGQNYSLRVDLKGAPVLRFLGLNFFRKFDVFTGCCVEPEDPVYVDPIDVLLQFAEQINADPVMSQYVVADVLTADGGDGGSAPDVVDPATYEPLTDATAIEAAIGALRLTVIYEDTLFGCSFDINDSVDTEPVVISSVQLVNELGDACPDFSQLRFTQTTAPVQSIGSGPRILQDWWLSNNYRQELYHPSVRRRQIEGTDYVLGYYPLNELSLFYWSYYILYSTGRKSNPTGMYDHDQYLIQLNVESGTDMTDFETWMENYLDSAGSGVVLEVM